jgi:hypothetical protein
VVGGGEEEGERGRGGGKRGREQERDASVLCVELQAGQRRLLVPLLLLLLLEGCALKRRCAGCGPSEPLLHP